MEEENTENGIINKLSAIDKKNEETLRVLTSLPEENREQISQEMNNLIGSHQDLVYILVSLACKDQMKTFLTALMRCVCVCWEIVAW